MRSYSKPLVTSLVLLAAAAIACEVYQPTTVAPDLYLSSAAGGIRLTVDRIALAPMALDPESPESMKRTSRRVGKLVFERLKKAGYEVIPGRHFRDCWLETTYGIGLPKNPKTGRPDDEAFRKLWHACISQMVRDHAVDAVLDPSIDLSPVVYENNIARWHGVEEDVRSAAKRERGVAGFSGEVRALSVYVTLFDKQGHVLFRNAGGIELAAQLDPGLQGHRMIPKQVVLEDISLLTHAVEIALSPLLEARARPGAEAGVAPSAGKRSD